MLRKVLLDYVLIGALCAFATLSQAATAAGLAYSVQLLPELSPRSGDGRRYASYLGFDGLLNDKGQIAATLDDPPLCGQTAR